MTLVGGEYYSRNTGGLHSGEETANHGRWPQLCDDFTTRWSKCGEHTDLDTERSKVGEPAKGIGRDEESTVRERVGAPLPGGQVEVGDEFIGDEFSGEEAGDGQDLATGDAHQERDGVEDVAKDELQGELGDAESTADPGKEAVGEVDEGEDREYVGQNLSGDDETEHGTIREGVERVGRLATAVFGTAIDDDLATGDGLVDLGVAQFGDGNRSGDRHDGCSHQVLGRDTERDVGTQNGTGDGRETRGHGQMEFGVSHDINIGANQARRFALADEGRSGSDNGFSTGDVHGLEEEPRELLNKPLHNAELQL